VIGLDLGSTYASMAASDGVRTRTAHDKPMFVKGRLVDSARALDLIPQSVGESVVVSVPVRAWLDDRNRLKRERVKVVPSAYAASAGGEDGIYIDIGAGTIDLCRVRNGAFNPGDLICLWTGADALDEFLFKRWKTPSIGAARAQKEEGKEDREGFRIFFQPVLDAIEKLTSTLPSEQAEGLRSNIVLSGGGSKIRGLDRLLGARLVREPEWAAARGALKFAMERWTWLSFE
jgi:actin-related protein